MFWVYEGLGEGLIPELDLSPMDLYKVVRDGHIVKDNVEDAMEAVAEEVGKEDYPNTMANKGVL